MTETLYEIINSPKVEVKEPLIEVQVQEVQFLADGVRVLLTGGIDKVVSLEDFRDILNRSIGELESTTLDGFNMPSNVFYFGKSSSEIHLSCYYKGGIMKLNLNSKIRDSVMPNIIISHKLTRDGDKNWLIQDSRYYCTDASISKLPKTFIYSVSPRDRVFLLPLSNTYGDARMCYGSNTMVSRFTENNLRGLDWYYEYLFQSPFNTDLGIKALASESSMYVEDWFTLLARLATERAPFPYDKLNGYTAP